MSVNEETGTQAISQLLSLGLGILPVVVVGSPRCAGQWGPHQAFPPLSELFCIESSSGLPTSVPMAVPRLPHAPAIGDRPHTLAETPLGGMHFTALGGLRRSPSSFSNPYAEDHRPRRQRG